MPMLGTMQVATSPRTWSAPRAWPASGLAASKLAGEPKAPQHVGSGRPPKLQGMKALLVMAMTVKAGFQEVPFHELPERARLELAKKVRESQAVSCWMHPGTGQIRAIVQSEHDREDVRVWEWTGQHWASLM